MAIMKLKKNDDKVELEFELSFQATLTVQERFEMMFERSHLLSEMMEKNGHRKSFEIIKRK